MTFFNDIPWLGLFGALFLGLLIWSLIAAHRDPQSEVNVFDVVMTDGRLDPLKVMCMGGFFFITWTMARLVLADRITEGYLSLYMASCFTPVLIRLFAPKDKQ